MNEQRMVNYHLSSTPSSVLKDSLIKVKSSVEELIDHEKTRSISLGASKVANVIHSLALHTVDPIEKGLQC